jgi:hypothetical protein
MDVDEVPLFQWAMSLRRGVRGSGYFRMEQPAALTLSPGVARHRLALPAVLERAP